MSFSYLIFFVCPPIPQKLGEHLASHTIILSFSFLLFLVFFRFCICFFAIFQFVSLIFFFFFIFGLFKSYCFHKHIHNISFFFFSFPFLENEKLKTLKHILRRSPTNPSRIYIQWHSKCENEEVRGMDRWIVYVTSIYALKTWRFKLETIY